MFFKRLGTFILDFLQIILFAVGLFLFVYLLILQPHKIKGNSMYPNFLDGEFLLTDKVTYRFNEPQRGDVVVFKAPNDKDEYIKRIIGLPGESVMVKNGKLYVDNQLLAEIYLVGESLYSPAGTFAKEGIPITVEANSFFVMGDNRNHSYDSRNFGLITEKDITGRAWLLYWPVNKAGVIEKVAY